MDKQYQKRGTTCAHATRRCPPAALACHAVHAANTTLQTLLETISVWEEA